MLVGVAVAVVVLSVAAIGVERISGDAGIFFNPIYTAIYATGRTGTETTNGVAFGEVFIHFAVTVVIDAVTTIAVGGNTFAAAIGDLAIDAGGLAAGCACTLAAFGLFTCEVFVDISVAVIVLTVADLIGGDTTQVEVATATDATG